MAKKVNTAAERTRLNGIVNKGTSIGGTHSSMKTSTMNKHKRRGYKRYRGQGR